MKTIAYITVGALILNSCAVKESSEKKQHEKMNVLFISVDDLND